MNMDDLQFSYIVDVSTIFYQKNIIKMTLKNANSEILHNSRDLAFKLYILKEGIFRVKIREVLDQEENESGGNFQKKRFKIKKEDQTFNMKSMAKKKNVNIANTTLDEMTISYSAKSRKNQFYIEIDNTKKTKYELKINYNPFNLTYSINNKHVLYINSKNLLDMEFPPEDFIKTEQESRTSVKLDIRYPGCQFLYGLPERASDIELKDTAEYDGYRLYNIDNFQYSRDSSLGLYGSLPFILSQSHGREIVSGVIWNNPSETYVGVHSTENGKDVLWISEGGIIDISFFAATNIHNFYNKYHMYIGFTPLPPLFALGYHQSRYSYKHIHEVSSVDKLFDEYDIPYDSIWLDIDHTDERKYLTWNEKFNGIDDFMETLEDKGRVVVTIIDPHIKTDIRYFLFREALSKNFLIKAPPETSTSAFIGNCWCGDAVYLDFFDINARHYWKQLLIETSSYFFDATNVHIWNDMNEPTVFDQPELTLPKMAVVKYDNSTYDHRDVHNLYGYFMHKTTYEAMKKKYQKRPFVLTRSFYLGSHKFGATWTGDNSATFEDMELTIPMIISSSISGLSFIGADVGGFAGDGEHFLYSRWYMLGAFYPFFRGHSHENSHRREPWLFDDDTFSVIKSSIITRYKLLPYIYTTFFQHYKTGFPIIRPIWFKYQFSNIDSYTNKEFFLGDALLIRPVLNFIEHSENV